MTTGKNCLILGSGRSGTSMLAGCFYHAGYYMGERLMPPNEQNAKGYFESFDVEAINERILSYNMYETGLNRLLSRFRRRLHRGQYWLSEVPVSAGVSSPRGVLEDINALFLREPFAFKDPRFSYTLPAWREHLGDCAFVTVFREPGRTVRSVLSTCSAESYLKTLAMTESGAFRIWVLQYRHIIERHARQGRWYFLHYNQILDGTGLKKLSEGLGVQLDASFPDPELKRSPDIERIPNGAKEVYLRLCQLADYTPGCD